MLSPGLSNLENLPNDYTKPTIFKLNNYLKKLRVHNNNNNLYIQGTQKVWHRKCINCHNLLDSLKYSLFHTAHYFDIGEEILMDSTYFQQENPDRIPFSQRPILQAKSHYQV